MINPDALINQFGSQSEVGKVYKNSESGLYFSYSKMDRTDTEATGYFMIFQSYEKRNGKYVGVNPVGYEENYENKETGYRLTIIYDMDGKLQNYDERRGDNEEPPRA